MLRRPYMTLLGIFLLFFSVINTFAATEVFITRVPAAKEVIIKPKGNGRCLIQAAGFYNGVWVNEHEICRYPAKSLNQVWISGHWQCTRYNTMQGCSRWLWINSHWVTVTRNSPTRIIIQS